MQLVNATPLAAGLQVTEVLEGAPRIGILTAKATFCFDDQGAVTVEDQEPIPYLKQDLDTELGLIPRDDLPRDGDDFEVILLGKAFAPRGRPVERMRVSLAVGAVKRELLVVGDREWIGTPGALARPRISSAKPFTEMPLTWSRAFGGSVDVLVDEESPVTLCDTRNPDGVGFDPKPAADALAAHIGCPKGYPAWEGTRRLPNLEDPRAPISGWKDDPDPLCWATLSMQSGLHARRVSEVLKDHDDVTPEYPPGTIYLRAHPDWVIERPPAGAPVTLEGLTPAGRVTFELPRLRVFADFTISGHEGSAELAPMTLLVDSARARLALTYRLNFQYAHEDRSERCFRLRTEEGWYSPVEEAAR